MDQGELRAGDADRERVAERLRMALEEGRLNLYEYDDRLREAFAAKTYADLDALLADLPGTAPAERSRLVPAPGAGSVPDAHWQVGPDGRYPHATRRWLAEHWRGWVTAVSICTGIWLVQAIMMDMDRFYFWPGWVAGPWGVVLVVQTVVGLTSGEPQRWAAKRARKEVEKEVRRQAERDGDDG